MYTPDCRGGCLRLDDLQARFDGIDDLPPNKAVFVVETEEESRWLRSWKLQAIYPTHGPLSIRCIANHQPELQGRVIILVYRPDPIGREWFNTAAGILHPFSRVRPLKISGDPVAYFRDKEPDHFRKMVFALFPVSEDGLSHPSFSNVQLLNVLGVRLLNDAVGVWSDLDCPELEDVIEQVEIDLPIAYLDDERIDPGYRIRHVPLKHVDESFSTFLTRCFI